MLNTRKAEVVGSDEMSFLQSLMTSNVNDGRLIGKSPVNLGQLFIWSSFNTAKALLASLGWFQSSHADMFSIRRVSKEPKLSVTTEEQVSFP
jgi:folate-binding Fe-S cluster repair protein YgfZ